MSDDGELPESEGELVDSDDNNDQSTVETTYTMFKAASVNVQVKKNSKFSKKCIHFLSEYDLIEVTK